MSIKYDVSAIDLLHILGYTQPQRPDIPNILAEFEIQNKIQLPTILKEYLLLAMENPLLRTADVWANVTIPFIGFSEESEEEYLEIGSDYESEENAIYLFHFVKGQMKVCVIARNHKVVQK